MDNLRKFIKTKKQNRVYRYSIRRLSIGVVSCVVGAFVLFSPVKFGNAELSGVVYASEVEPKNSERLGALSIKVQDENRKTIMGVKVKLYNNEHEYIETSDENGNLAFSAKPGDYKYEVISIPKRFEDSTLGVKTIKIESNKVTNGAVINLKNKDVEILGFLTEQEKNELKNGLKNPLNDRMEDRLKGKDNLQALYDKYEEINKKNKNKIIKEAEGKIDKLILLSEEDRGLYKSKLKDSSNKKDIDQIVGEAEEKNIRQGKTKYTLMVKEVDKDGNIISLLKTVEDLTAEKLSEETEKFVDGADYKDETGNYKVVGTVEMDGTTAVVKVIEVKLEKTKYTLKIKEVDKDGNVISMLKIVEDLTAEKLNEETEKFVDGADYKDETGNYKVVGTVEMDGTTAVVKVVEVFTVTFDSNGGSQVAPVVVKKGKEAAKPEDPRKEGFKFERWELAGKEYDFNSPVEKNITLKAVWSMKATPIEPIEMVTVTFDSNGGTPVAAKEVQKGKAVAKPEEPKAEGLTFERWELAGKEYDFNSPVEKNITLKAVWSMKATPLTPSIKVAPRAFRNDNDQRGSIDWRYIKAPSKDAKTEVQKQKTVIEVKVTIGSDILQRKINNHTQEIKMDTTAFIKDGRTMLPIRYVAEALGYTVEWREDTRTAILKDKETTIEIPVDTNKIIVNGKEIQSDVKPMIENGRTMLPIANVARALGLKDGQDIKWDESKQEVTIRKEILN